MSATPQLHPRYVVGDDGKREAVMLPLGEYEELLEDLRDLAVLAERRDEGTVTHEKPLAELRRDGLLPRWRGVE